MRKWEKKTLKDLVKISKGNKCEATENGVRYIQIDDLRNDNNLKYTSLQGKKVLCNEKDILIAWDGANAGTIGYNLNGAIGSTLAKLSPKMEYYTPYLGKFLQSKFRYLRDNCTGATIPHISTAVLTGLKIPLPPLLIQQQIAEVLDTADEIRRSTQEQLDALDELAQGVFLEMFGDSSKWQIVKLGDLSEVQGGLQVSHKRAGNPIELPYLRVANVFRSYINLDEVKTMRVTASEAARIALKKDDILIVEGHGNKNEIGRSAVWKNEIENCLHQNHLIRVRLNQDKFNPIFVDFFMNSDLGKSQIQALSNTTSGLNTITTTDVKSMKITLPTLPLQTQFAAIITNIEEQKAVLRESLRESEALFGGLLQRVFG